MCASGIRCVARLRVVSPAVQPKTQTEKNLVATVRKGLAIALLLLGGVGGAQAQEIGVWGGEPSALTYRVGDYVRFYLREASGLSDSAVYTLLSARSELPEDVFCRGVTSGHEAPYGGAVDGCLGWLRGGTAGNYNITYQVTDSSLPPEGLLTVYNIHVSGLAFKPRAAGRIYAGDRAITYQVGLGLLQLGKEKLEVFSDVVGVNTSPTDNLPPGVIRRITVVSYSVSTGGLTQYFPLVTNAESDSDVMAQSGWKIQTNKLRSCLPNTYDELHLFTPGLFGLDEAGYGWSWLVCRESPATVMTYNVDVEYWSEQTDLSTTKRAVERVGQVFTLTVTGPLIPDANIAANRGPGTISMGATTYAQFKYPPHEVYTGTFANTTVDGAPVWQMPRIEHPYYGTPHLNVYYIRGVSYSLFSFADDVLTPIKLGGEFAPGVTYAGGGDGAPGIGNYRPLPREQDGKPIHLQGEFTEPSGVRTFVYEANDEYNKPASTFTMQVFDRLSFPEDRQLTYVFNVDQPGAVTLPPAEGGKAPLTYDLTEHVPLVNPSGTLPDALGFDVDTRILTASFTAEDEHFLRYVGGDVNGVGATYGVTIRAVDELLFEPSTAIATYSVGNTTHVAGGVQSGVALTLPSAQGGADDIDYRVVGLPPGLNAALKINPFLNGFELLISGAPTAPGDYTTLRIAEDDVEQIATFTLSTHIAPAPHFADAIGEQTYSRNFAIAELALPEVSGGVAPFSYALHDSAGADFVDGESIVGLTYDAAARIVRGTPNDPSNFILLTFTATDHTNARAALAITMRLVPQLTFTRRQGNYTFTVGEAGLHGMSDAAGGVGDLTYSLEIANPADTALDFEFRQVARSAYIGLTATAVYPPTSYIYTAHDEADNTVSATFTMTVVAAPHFLDSQDDLLFTVDTAVDEITLPRPVAGHFPFSYTLDKALPPGVTFNANYSVATVGGTPTAVRAQVDYILTATDFNFISGSMSPFGIRVYPAPSFAASGFGPFTFTANAPQKSFALPSVVDDTGAPAIAYQFEALDLFDNGGDAGVDINDLVTLDAATRSVTGSFAAKLQFRVRLTATDSNNVAGTSGYATFTVVDEVALAQLDLDAIANQTYRVAANVNRTLPQVTGGVAPFAYSLSDADGNAYSNNIANIAFDASTRVLSGTVASSSVGDYTFSYSGVDDNAGEVNAPMRINIVAPIALPQPNDVIYYTSTSGINTPLPQAENTVGDVTYQLSNLTGNGLTLPSGIVFNANAPSLTGATNADTVVETMYRYTATDLFDGATITVTFRITIGDLPTLATPRDVTFSVGVAKAVNLPSVLGGVAPHTYRLTAADNLPSWLTYSGVNAEDTVPLTFGSTATAPSSAQSATLTYSVFDRIGTAASAVFTVRAVPAPRFSDTQEKLHATIGNAIADTQLPRAIDGALPLSYSLSPALPNGLVVNDSVLISGTPASDATVGEANYTLVATDANAASAQLAFALEVYPLLAFAQLNPSDAETFTVGTDKTLQFSLVEGGRATLAYALDLTGNNALSGLQFDATSRQLTGTFAAQTSAINLTYEVTDANGATIQYPFTLAAVPAPTFADAQGALTFTVSGDIGAINLPRASGGLSPLRYSLDNVLPAGVSLDADDASLTGTPTTTQATVNYVLTATDVNGASESLSAFGIRVYPAPSFAASGFGPFTFTANAPQKSFTLPPVVDGGGAPVVAYNFGALDLFDNGGDAGVNINNLVTLDNNNRSVAGSFAAALQFRVQLTATDSNNVADTSAYATFTVVDEVALAQLDLNAIANQTYRVAANVNRTLPQVTGGISPIVYSLSDTGGNAYSNNIANIAFDASTRALSGTVASSSVGDYTFSYSGVDANDGEVNAPMRINIVAPLALPQPNDVIYYTSINGINTALPQAANIVGDVTYQLSNLSDNELTLPNGIAFNANAPSLTGATNTDTVAETRYRYTATDSFDGASVTVTFTISVSDAPVIAAQNDVTFTVGTAKAVTLPNVVGGVAPHTYRLTAAGNLPSWLTYSGTNGVDTAALTFGSTATAPATAQNAVSLTYTVRDNLGTSSSVAFNVLAVAAPRFSDTQDKLHATIGTPIADTQLPRAIDGALPLAYSLTPALPNGLVINDSVLISGTAASDASVGEANYTLVATDANAASAQLAFALEVYPPLAFAQVNPSDAQTFTVGADKTLQFSPVEGGRAPLGYALDLTGNTALSGVQFDASTRELTGTFAAQTSAINLTYQVTDANGATIQYPFTLAAVNAPNFTDTVAAQTYIRTQTAVDLQLPQVNDGLAPLVYSLTDSAGNAFGNGAVIGGLVFDAGAQKITGTPTAAVGAYALTFAATDVNAAADALVFTITIVNPLTFASPQDDLFFSTNQSIARQLTQAAGGIGALTYGIALQNASDTPLTNVAVDAATAELTAAAHASPLARTAYLLTAGDQSGNTATTTFGITVVEAPTFDDTQPDITFTVGATKSTRLPSASGFGDILYALSGAPSWLNVTPTPNTQTTDTFTLSAAPSAPQVATLLTYTATDANGASIQLSFNVLAVAAPSFADTQVNLTFTVGAAIVAINLPSASGGALPLRYAFDNNLPSGVALNEDDAILTGTPTTAQATVNYILTATDANGASGSLPAFGMRVYPAPSFAASGFGPFTFTANAPQKSFLLPPVIADTGAPAIRYAFDTLTLIDGGGLLFDFSSWVTLNDAARSISGSFDAPVQFHTRIIATDNNNVTAASPNVTFVVADEVTFAQLELDGIADQTYRVDAGINRILPQMTGGVAPIVYSLSDTGGNAYANNIANVTFDATTRAFSGAVAPAAVGDYTFIYAGKDDNDGALSAPMRINIVDSFTLATPADVVYYATENNISTALPQAENVVGNVTYQLRDLSGNGLTLPSGITFNANANAPSLTGATVGNTFPTTQYRYTATDSFDGESVTVTFTVTVSDSPVTAAQNDVTFTVGIAKAITLPNVVGGVAPHTYRLTTNGNLPSWLTYSGTNGQDTAPLTFGSTTSAPSSVQSSVSLTYTVRDSLGTESSVVFNVLAVNAPSFSGTQDALTFTVNGNIGTINLPTANGGALPLRYALDNNLPAGVSLNENDARLTGIPLVTQATVNYVLTATDVNGANGSLSAFGIRVYPAPSFAANGFGPFTFTANAPQKSFTLPQVVGGSGAPVVVYNFEALDLFDDGGDAGVVINDLVTLDATTRSVAGSFTAALQFRAQLTATDDNSVSDTSSYATFVVVDEVALAQLDLNAIADQTYRVGANINRILPPVTGGVAPIVYTLSDAGDNAYNNNIANIAFTANTRAFSGTIADSAAGDYTFTYAGVDANDGEASAPMRIKIFDSLALAQPDDVIYYATMSGINTALPQAENVVGDVTYQLRDLSGGGLTLPGGIVFNANANAPSLTGATEGNAFPTTQYRYTVTDSFDGESVTVTFTVTVSDSPVTAAQADITFTVGIAQAVTLPNVVGGVAPHTYRLTTNGNLPSWLTYSGTNGEDTVPLTFGSTATAPSTAQNAVPLTYTVRDSLGTESSAAFNVLAVDAPSFAGTQDDLTFTVSGNIGTINLPTASGGALPLRYTLNNNLPAGVLLNADDSILTGVPTASQATANYVLTATDVNGASGSLSAFNIRVYPAPSFAATGFGPFTFTANAPQKSFTLPQVVNGTGAPAIAYNFGALNLFDNGGNAGVNINDFVTLDATTRSVAGEFTAALQFRAQLIATDDNNVSDTSPYATFVVVNEVTLSQAAIDNIADQTYRTGANVNLILPQVTGGVVPIVYSLSDTNGNAYNNNIANVAFTANTRAFAGTIAESSVGDYTFAYTGVDANDGEHNTPMRIKVVASLALAQPDDVVYYETMSGINTVLPQAENVVGNITYQLRDLSGNGLTLPSGIAFNANAPSLTGATVGSTFPVTQYRYTATDSFDGESVTVTFTITVSDSPVTAAQADITFTVGIAQAVTLPNVVGGIAPHTYRLTTNGILPSWLTYSGINGEDTVPLTFGSTATAPSTAQNAVPLTYTVRDSLGTESSAAFNVLAVNAPSFAGTQDDLTFTVSGNIGTINLPTASGGALPLRYTLNNNLPAGVLLNADDSILTGVPTASQATSNYVLTATDANGASGSLSAFNIRVYPAPSFAASGFGPFTFTANAPQKSFTLPQVVNGTGAPVVAYNFGALDLFNNGGNAGVNINDFVTLDTTARSVAGSFAASLQFRAQLTATDDNNVSDTSPYATFVVVNEVTLSQAAIDNIADQTYRTGANVNLILPQVTGGIAPIVYSLSDTGGNAYNNNIANVAFTANTRAFAGTIASSAVGDYIFTYTGKDANDGEHSTPMRIKVVALLALAQPDDVVYYETMSGINTVLPQAENVVGNITYQLRNLSNNGLNLPSGIAFNANAPSLTGATAGNIFPTTQYRYTATDSFDGESVTVTFNLTVSDAPIVAAQADVTFTVGAAKAVTLPNVSGGVAPYTYRLTAANLPNWLTYSGTNGEDTAPLIFGSTATAPASAQSATPLTYTVRDSEGAASSVVFNVLAVTAPSFAGAQGKLHATIGVAIADTQLPQASGGALPLAYSTSPALPNGLAITANGALLSGAPANNASVGEVNYLLTATDANGAHAQLAFVLEVYSRLSFADANPRAAQSFSVGAGKALTFSQVAGGRAPLAYALDLSGNAALSGLQFDATSRALSGVFAATASAINLTYRATDQNGATIQYPFTVAAVAAPRFTTALGAQTYLRHRIIDSLYLPDAVGGVAPLSYALTDLGGATFGDGDVIDGLTHDDIFRGVTGTPLAAVGDYQLRYRVVDANGASGELTFVVTLVNPIAFAQAQDDLVFSVNQAISRRVQQAEGGIGALTYAIAAHSGAALSGVAVQLTGGDLLLSADTPTAVYPSTQYILSVVDASGDAAASTFAIRVVEGPAFDQPPADLVYSVGIAKSVTLPAANGDGVISYTLTDAPSWLTVAPPSSPTTDTFILSATPLAPQPRAVLVYTAVDENGYFTQAEFSVTAFNAPAFDQSPADLTFTVGRVIGEVALPSVVDEGAGEIRYSLMPALPFGLRTASASASAPMRLLGAPLQAQESLMYTYTATDSAGAFVRAAFAIKIYPTTALDMVGDITFTVGVPKTHALSPAQAGGAPPLTYALLDSNGQPLPRVNAELLFDPDPSQLKLVGHYTKPLATLYREELRYRVTDASGAAVEHTFATLAYPAPTFTADGNITFAVSTFDLDNPFAHSLPKVKTGTGAPTITYQLGAAAALPSWLSANQWMADGAQLTFAIAADPVVTVTIDRTTLDAVEAAVAQSQPLPTVTYQHMAIDANGANTTLPLRITLMPGVRAEFINDGVSRDFVDVSKVILSEAAGTLASNAIGAIANRIANARAGGFAVNGIGGQSPIFYLGGQHSLEGIIAANSKALADDTFDEKNLLSGTKFSLPFNAQGAPGEIGNGMAIWGAGEYKEMNGATGEVDWDGELRSLYFGIDGLMFANSDALGGVAIAFSKLTADYADIGADTRAGSGDYEMRLTTLYPYYSWRNDNIDWWAGAGYGEGDLKITRNADRDYSTDVFMRTMAAGANILAGIFDRTRLHIKAETIVSRLKLSQSADLAQQKIDTGLARITATVAAAKRLPGGGRYEPSYSFGWRYDFGDSDLDASLEKTFGWRFVNAAGRLSGELRLQGAYDGHTYREWGAYALIRSEAGADGQGVSLQLRPSYGATGLDVNRLWQGGGLQAFGGDAVAPDEYTMQVDARVGFGVTGVWNGLLTPFAEWSYSAAGDIYRLGLDWAASEWLVLNLLGEYEALGGGDFRRSIWVRGQARF